MKFFEQYWGYTLIGGVTLGTLITNVVVFIKLLITNKLKNTESDDVLTKASELQDKLAEKDKQYAESLAKMEQHQTEYFKELERKQKEYNNKLSINELKSQQVQAVLFTAVSYLIMGSKLEEPVKLDILKKMNNLLDTPNTDTNVTNTVKEELVQAVSNYVTEKVVEPTEVEMETAEQIIKNTVHTLFDKYNKGE
jgi:citrate synthase